MNKTKRMIMFVGVILVFAIFIAMTVFSFTDDNSQTGGKGKNESLNDLVKEVFYTNSDLIKGSVELGNMSLYDELAEIEKYPLQVKGNSDLNIEVFSSGEKAGDGYESWLLDVAEKFNSAGVKTSSGKKVSVSVRQMSSGLGADYIISNKYVPDMYTPSSELFGEYAKAQGGKLELLTSRLVGNTAGLLVTKGKGYKTVKEVADAVSGGKLNLGYTNPQTSATGMNLLVTLLNEYDSKNMLSDNAKEGFKSFQENIPYVAYTTMQMRDSASNGKLDGMVIEYQTYINEDDLNSVYDFIPFGVRHDNPLYITSKSMSDSERKEACKLFSDFCLSKDSQSIATKDGFNANNDYKSSIKVSGAEISKALDMYKENKDSGKDIIAVFIADCSGSMDGEPLNRLKSSLSNGANYINSNNEVGLISYSSDVRIDLPIGKFDLNQRAYFQGAINNMSANGGTSSYNAVVVAMNMIEEAKKNNPDAKTMIFLLSDGEANEGLSFDRIKPVLKNQKTPVYTISYTVDGDREAMKELSSVNEAASIDADSDDVIYKIKSLFNSQL